MGVIYMLESNLKRKKTVPYSTVYTSVYIVRVIHLRIEIFQKANLNILAG